ncbi:MAG TPA: sulfotransferase [Rhizomicrobium sp.]|jgi:tetratricopeptide (TPR) repeat protein|nr:sulfotransferase [Rhizomicrobium sp.]
MTATARAKSDPLLEAQKQLFPPLRNPVLARAVEALAASQLEVAEPIVAKFLKRDPKSPDALNLMADIARRNGRLDEAEQLLARCVERSPHAQGYRYNYALILKARNQPKRALVPLDELLDGDPRNPLFRDQKAKVLASVPNRREETLDYRRTLAEDYPDFAPFWLLYGDSLRDLGQTECISAYCRSLALDPSQAEIYQRLCDLKTYRFLPEEIRQMEVQLGGPGIASENRAKLHFSLGKAYGDETDYAKSFDNYLKGNALRRLGLNTDSDQFRRYREICESLYTPAFFRERAGWGCESRAPIFIVGLPRAGSTLLEQILSSHSAIEGLGELPAFERIVFRRLSRAGKTENPESENTPIESQEALLGVYRQAFQALTAGDARAMGEDYLARAASRRKTETAFFTDKAGANFGHCGLIRLMLPNAKIIDARRHPLSCGWSCFTNLFPGIMPFSYRLDDIGQHYVNYVRIMAHFEQVLPGRIHRVLYEQVIADPEGEVRRLLDFLELPFEEQCLRFHENKRTVRTLSSEQVRKPLYRKDVEQWVPYEQWLGPLKAELGPVLECYPEVPDFSPRDAADLPSRAMAQA